MIWRSDLHGGLDVALRVDEVLAHQYDSRNLHSKKIPIEPSAGVLSAHGESLPQDT